jgi:myo-inositol-1(or 4)-monophosphatase
MMMPGDLEEMLAVADELAAGAGSIIAKHWGNTSARRKTDGSPVTDADLEAEEYITAGLNRRFPGHDVLGEEGSAAGHRPGGSRFCWLVDPLDGTRNFARGFPCVATSIALVENGVPVVGLIRDHLGGRVYSAIAGGGAYLDGTSIRMVRRELDREFFVGVPSVKRNESPAAIKGFLDTVNVRNVGSTAVHLALVACGAMDAIYASRCHAWDVAAGYVMVCEAGGVCTTPTGGELLPLPPADDPASATPILAAGPHAHTALVEMICRATGGSRLSTGNQAG